jgi:inhibitor of cysteine peptidase
MKKTGYITLILISLLVMLAAAYGFSHVKDPMKVNDLTDSYNTLPTVDSLENLKKLLNDYAKKQESLYMNYRRNAIEMQITNTAQDSQTKSEAAADSGFGGDYSTTNVQVRGVDEADIVKTDGKYLYQINNQEIIIIDAKTPESLEIVSRITVDDASFQPNEMYLGDSYLAVIGYSYRPIRMPKPIIYDSSEPEMQSAPKAEIFSPYYPSNTVYLKLYDIKDKKNIKKVREIALEGNYVSSRKINDTIYMVANNYIHYHIMNNLDGEEASPYYKDTLLGEGIEKMDFNEISYFPDAIEPNYITIMGLNIKDFNEKANIYTYLGHGENIYASLENLYIAVNKYEPDYQRKNKPGGFIEDLSFPPMLSYANNTEVYKFELSNSKVLYKNKEKVPGRILNQFSMDEYEGYFRIATTTGDMWRTDEFTSKNNVYILDQDMELIGKLEGIAPTERIYSMRFMGSRGYMVTFRETDPFYVIDLKEPKEPKILGYLKIPGYSDYLHPYDENHIIGFGKEVYEMKGTAFQAGMKVAVFDVRDVSQPIEKFKVEIGDRGTESPLLRDHKALLFSKEKNLLVFPVTLVENKSGNHMAWGEFTYQGAYVYHLDMTEGFKLKGRITHLTEEDYKKAGSYWFDSNRNVNRILYIGNTLYTFSNEKIKANQLHTIHLIDELLLK